MPPKSKGSKAKESDKSSSSSKQPAPGPSSSTAASSSSAADQPPRTVQERSQQRYKLTRPLDFAHDSAGGLDGLGSADRLAWINAKYLPLVTSKRVALTAKATKDLWKVVNDASLPIRTLPKARAGRDVGAAAAGRPSVGALGTKGAKGAAPGTGDGEAAPVWSWGTDRSGRDVGTYSLEQFEERLAKQVALTAHQLEHRAFLDRRDRAARGFVDPDAAPEKKKPDGTEKGGEAIYAPPDQDEIIQEKKRREDMSRIRADLYGEKSSPYAADPEWDDVVPIPLEEPEGALAAIAYPEEYAEAMSYLRAVMASQEHSPRALRLTEHCISMNPAHYTVWLYRFAIVKALDLDVRDEIAWLNEVALTYLKNYQIWHHRQLLLEWYHPRVVAEGGADAPQARAELARLRRSETDFITRMLAEDAKNYHVWSYRVFLVRLLAMFGSPAELVATEAFIDQDVRNNSAWSHRFFLVFSDPKYHPAGDNKAPQIPHSTEADPAVPADVIDRELAYARSKIPLAPQNQSAWNYLRGVLTKGGRDAAGQREFAESFVRALGEGEDSEAVTSTHALDLLSEIYARAGETDRAALCLRRLAEKWDPVRKGYWVWRAKVLLGEVPEIGEEGEEEEEEEEDVKGKGKADD